MTFTTIDLFKKKKKKKTIGSPEIDPGFEVDIGDYKYILRLVKYK